MKSVSQTRKPLNLTPEESFQDLLLSFKLYWSDTSSIEKLEKAFEFSKYHHRNQFRQSGELYILHPIEVAKILTRIKIDNLSILVALLHDVVEDTQATLEEVRLEFGDVVAELVDGLTKIRKIKFRSNHERMAENFRKMILAMAKDLRVILIKLADRLHNMRTLDYLKPEKRYRIANETLEIYAPLANRLGIYEVKSELEDLCFRALHYGRYKEISQKVAVKKVKREAYIENIKIFLEKKLKHYSFAEILVSGRPKHFFSIYKKMIDRNITFEEIHDLFAFRILVQSVKDCYEALGVIHATWKPMPGRFKDYIAIPKANMYQSLHTTVIQHNGEPIEIQIRTKDMHEICEYGIAAHWRYKVGNNEEIASADLKKFSWLRQMMQWQSELEDPKEFLESIKIDLFDDEIFVFTPKGDVLQLVRNATALDFAFAVHTDIGLKAIGAKVNGKIVPIRLPISSGDIVEIFTNPQQNPSKDWLKFVKTSKARNKIRSFHRSIQRDKGRKIGYELFEQELRKHNLSIEELKTRGELEKLASLNKQSKFDDLLVMIGYGKLNSKSAIAKLYPEKLSLFQTPSDHYDWKGKSSNPKILLKKNPYSILVSGIKNMLLHTAKCCNPVPGELIMGFITRGKGVSIHREDCLQTLSLDPHRRVDVSWGEDVQKAVGEYYMAYIRVTTQDKTGVLENIVASISRCGANIQKAKINVLDNMLGTLFFELKVRNLDQLQEIIFKLENLANILKVERVSGCSFSKKHHRK